MKLINNRSLLIMLLLVTAFGYIASCTHDNELPPPPPVKGNFTPGNNIHLPGNMTTGNKAEWKLDKSHCSVLWQTNYVGASGLLTGRFNQFGMHEILPGENILYHTASQPVKDTSWAFYENDPTKTYFNGYVQINTSNTGEPGRDTGCNIAGMGTVKIVPGVQNLLDLNIARIKSTKVAYDVATGEYVVNISMTWTGKLTAPLTKTYTGRLKYIPKSTIAGAAPYDVFGLQLKFQFNCRDYGIVSTSTSDIIEMECNMNFHNK
jgi:hypothetical protein